MSATVTHLFNGVPSSATTAEEDVYDDVELKSNTKNDSAAQHEEIELSTNAAYGRANISSFLIQH